MPIAPGSMNFAALRADGRPLIVGILNITPDSFSDGGRYQTVADACRQAERMLAEGADIIDIGAESTRPGAAAVAAACQLERVLPVIEALTDRLPQHACLSIDTQSPEVAAQALRTGVRIVNDISAGDAAGMFECVAAADAGMVLMHMQGTPATMQAAPHYVDVVEEVTAFLRTRAEAALRAGLKREQLLIDPGIGFGKNREHNLRLLAGLGRLVDTGYGVLLGTSRKRFMGAICAETDFRELVGATCATTALGVMAGVRAIRVHDVKDNRQAADVAWAMRPFTAY
jgi:dihydropteroate synthase